MLPDPTTGPATDPTTGVAPGPRPGPSGDRAADPPSGCGRRAVALALAAGRDVARLVVPVACAGCGLPDVPWCTRCAPALHGAPVRRDQGAGRLDLLDGRTLLPVWAPAVYAGPVRHAVAAWKDAGRQDLDRHLVAAARGAGAGVAAHVRGGAVAVVPVPSTAAARRRRGRAPVDLLAAAVAAGLRDAGVPAARAAVLARGAGPDLAGLSARARRAALVGAVRVRGRARPAGLRVLLVDDVLTTGATLAACRAALVGDGAQVLGAVALAATPAPSSGGAPGGRPPGLASPAPGGAGAG